MLSITNTRTRTHNSLITYNQSHRKDSQAVDCLASIDDSLTETYDSNRFETRRDFFRRGGLTAIGMLSVNYICGSENKNRVDERVNIFFINPRLRELARKNIDSLFAFEITRHSAYVITKEDIKIARENPDSIFAMGVAMHMNPSENKEEGFTKEDIEKSRKIPHIKFYFGLLQNLKRPIEKVDLDLIKRGRNDDTVYSSSYWITMTRREDYKPSEEEIQHIDKEWKNISWYIFCITQNPNLLKNPEQRKKYTNLFIQNPRTWSSQGLGANRNFIITHAVRNKVINESGAKGCESVRRNPKYKMNPIALAKNNYGDYLHQLPCENFLPVQWTMTECDYTIAKEFPNTNFAYAVALSGTIPIHKVDPSDYSSFFVDLSFAMKNPNSAYAIGAVRNPNVSFTKGHITFALNNPDTEFAYELGKRLTSKQITDEIWDREKILAKLYDTKFASGIGQNYFLGNQMWHEEMQAFSGKCIFRLEDKKTAFIYWQTKLGQAMAMNPAWEIDANDKKQVKNPAFDNSLFAYNLTRNWNWKEVTKDDEQYTMDNYKKYYALGIAGNVNYFASKKMRIFAKELVVKEPDLRFLYELTKNPNYLANLSEDEIKKEVRFAMENMNSEYARGVFENYEVQITEVLKEFVRRNPNSKAATGAASNETYYVDENDKKFTRDPKNRKTCLAHDLLCKSDYIPVEQDLEIVNEAYAGKGSQALNALLFFNPHLTMFKPYVSDWVKER